MTDPRTDSYSSCAEVASFTRHLLDGQASFNTTTRPAQSDVVKMIDKASGVLNVALAGAGFTTPVTNSTAKLALDEWVCSRVVEHVELTQRGVGYSDGDGSRVYGFKNLARNADNFVKEYALGLKRLGVGVAHKASEGLAFTGQDAQADRADPDDTGLEQPKFIRGQWDNAS